MGVNFSAFVLISLGFGGKILNFCWETVLFCKRHNMCFCEKHSCASRKKEKHILCTQLRFLWRHKFAFAGSINFLFVEAQICFRETKRPRLCQKHRLCVHISACREGKTSSVLPRKNTACASENRSENCNRASGSGFFGIHFYLLAFF